MKFGELVEIIGDEAVFETGLLLAGGVRRADVRRQLSRWTAAGKLLQLRRGLYALAPPYRKTVAHPFAVANRLVPASYVSCESALAAHGLIPEHVPVTVSVTTGRPGRRETGLGRYEYRHVKPALFWGAAVIEVGRGQRALLARPEKALLDLVYLTEGGGTDAHLRGLRLQFLERLDLAVLDRFARRSGKPKLLRAARRLAELAREDAEEPAP